MMTFNGGLRRSILFLYVLIPALSVNAAIVENMQINMAAINYYNGTGAKKYFQLQTVGLTDAISVANLPVSTDLGSNTHEIDGTFQMTRTELKQDISTGATIGAKGIFYGGELDNTNTLVRSTFQLTGQLYSVQRDINGVKIGETLLYDGLLLEAEMTVDEFVLKEALLPNRVVSGDNNSLQVFYQPIGGSMFDGTSGLTIGDFRADFDMTNTSNAFAPTGVTNFDNQLYRVLGPVSVKIEAIPEPTTLALIGIGSLFGLTRRKKNTR